MSKSSKSSYSPPDGFELVYQSGHTNTYCNGDKHHLCSGGWAGNWPVHLSRVSECNCENFGRSPRDGVTIRG